MKLIIGWIQVAFVAVFEDTNLNKNEIVKRLALKSILMVAGLVAESLTYLLFCVELKPSLLSPTTSTTSTSQVSLWNLVGGILLYPGGLTASSGIEIFSLYIKYFPRQLQFIQCFITVSSSWTLVTEDYALGTQLFRQTGCTLTLSGYFGIIFPRHHHCSGPFILPE